jgi:hypothetical protein
MPTITDKAAPILWPVTNMLAFGWAVSNLSTA